MNVVSFLFLDREAQIWRPGLESLDIEQFHIISCSNQLYKWISVPKRMSPSVIEIYPFSNGKGYASWTSGSDSKKIRVYANIFESSKITSGF